MNLLIGIVSNRNPSWRFLFCLFGLQADLRSRGIPFATHFETGCSLLPQGRQNILDSALREGEFTHLLMLDDDMTFPPDTVMRLYEHGLLAIGVNATGRGNGVKYTAVGMDGKHIESHGKTGIQQVKTCGLAVFLINLDKSPRLYLGGAPPHFEISFSEGHQKYIGEDVYFCNKLTKVGIPIHIDHGLSHEIGHVGEFVYDYETVNS